jgi:hypothetical protein
MLIDELIRFYKAEMKAVTTTTRKVTGEIIGKSFAFLDGPTTALNDP